MSDSNFNFTVCINIKDMKQWLQQKSRLEVLLFWETDTSQLSSIELVLPCKNISKPSKNKDTKMGEIPSHCLTPTAY